MNCYWLVDSDVLLAQQSTSCDSVKPLPRHRRQGGKVYFSCMCGLPPTAAARCLVMTELRAAEHHQHIYGRHVDVVCNCDLWQCVSVLCCVIDKIKQSRPGGSQHTYILHVRTTDRSFGRCQPADLEQSAMWPVNTWHQLQTINILKHYWRHICLTRPRRFVTFYISALEILLLTYTCNTYHRRLRGLWYIHTFLHTYIHAVLMTGTSVTLQ